MSPLRSIHTERKQYRFRIINLLPVHFRPSRGEFHLRMYTKRYRIKVYSTPNVSDNVNVNAWKDFADLYLNHLHMSALTYSCLQIIQNQYNGGNKKSYYSLSRSLSVRREQTFIACFYNEVSVCFVWQCWINNDVVGFELLDNASFLMIYDDQPPTTTRPNPQNPPKPRPATHTPTTMNGVVRREGSRK